MVVEELASSSISYSSESDAEDEIVETDILEK